MLYDFNEVNGSGGVEESAKPRKANMLEVRVASFRIKRDITAFSLGLSAASTCGGMIASDNLFVSTDSVSNVL